DMSRVTEAEDDAGHWANYAYNADGLLTDVVLSTGQKRHYEYKKALMTEVRDEKGQVLLHNWYYSGTIVRQRFGNGDLYSYDYDWPQHTYFPKRVIITLP